MERPLDLVLFGATGFAGRLVAEYLQDHAPEGLRWAIAGRNAGKLQEVVDDLARRVPGSAPIPHRVADSADPAALDALAAETRVVCTTVGPYAKYGPPLVAACVTHGTHYCDLTGEPQFVRRMIDAHHEAARASGSRIVHCAGFDSIPSDLGVFVLQQAAIASGGPCDRVEYVLTGASGGFSGGTIASLANVLEELHDPLVRLALRDPYSLCPERGPDDGEQRGPRYRESVGAWTGPFLMAPINERVVRRSNALLGWPYGRNFRYQESMRIGSGPAGWLGAVALSAGSGLGMVALSVGPLRRLVLRALPAPGEGPDALARESGWFSVRLYGWRGDRLALRVDVRGKQDPGYGATACMLGETALALVAGESLGEPGITTPAAAVGPALAARLSGDARVTVAVHRD